MSKNNGAKTTPEALAGAIAGAAVGAAVKAAIETVDKDGAPVDLTEQDVRELAANIATQVAAALGCGNGDVATCEDTVVEEKVEASVEKIGYEVIPDKVSPLLSLKLDLDGLTTRTRKAFDAAKPGDTIGDVLALGVKGLSKFNGIGPKTAEEIHEVAQSQLQALSKLAASSVGEKEEEPSPEPAVEEEVEETEDVAVPEPIEVVEVEETGNDVTETVAEQAMGEDVVEAVEEGTEEENVLRDEAVEDGTEQETGTAAEEQAIEVDDEVGFVDVEDLIAGQPAIDEVIDAPSIDEFVDDDLSSFTDVADFVDEQLSMEGDGAAVEPVDSVQPVGTFTNGKIKSFTDAFMAPDVPSKPEPVDEDDPDLSVLVSDAKVPDSVLAAEERMFAGLERHTSEFPPIAEEEHEKTASADGPADEPLFDDNDDIGDLEDDDDYEDETDDEPAKIAPASSTAEDEGDDVIADLLAKMEQRKTEFGEFVKNTREQS